MKRTRGSFAVESRKRSTNGPKPGDDATVEPIRAIADVKAISARLADRPMERLLFVLGISTALRASDLVALDVGDVRGVSEIVLTEKKTGKKKRVTLNADVQGAVARWLDVSELGDDEPLFKGQRGRITVSYVRRMVKGWCAAQGLSGNYGSHTLRKTFGYHHRVTWGTDIPTLMDIFNHATQRQTLAYLCIQEKEIADVYSKSLL